MTSVGKLAEKIKRNYIAIMTQFAYLIKMRALDEHEINVFR